MLSDDFTGSMTAIHRHAEALAVQLASVDSTPSA